jgi:hypothetical protein
VPARWPFPVAQHENGDPELVAEFEMMQTRACAASVGRSRGNRRKVWCSPVRGDRREAFRHGSGCRARFCQAGSYWPSKVKSRPPSFQKRAAKLATATRRCHGGVMLLSMWRSPIGQVLGPPRHFFIFVGYGQHRSLGFRILDLLCQGSHIFGPFAPVFGVIDGHANHLRTAAIDPYSGTGRSFATRRGPSQSSMERSISACFASWTAAWSSGQSIMAGGPSMCPSERSV